MANEWGKARFYILPGNLARDRDPNCLSHGNGGRSWSTSGIQARAILMSFRRLLDWIPDSASLSGSDWNLHSVLSSEEINLSLRLGAVQQDHKSCAVCLNETPTCPRAWKSSISLSATVLKAFSLPANLLNSCGLIYSFSGHYLLNISLGPWQCSNNPSF